jgi:hypothetical protein
MWSRFRAEHEKKVAESKMLEAKGAWRPNHGPKTDMVRSVVKMNIR